jgi:hypothetical protein
MLQRRRSLIRLISRGITGTALLVCMAALITRLRPHVWPVSSWGVVGYADSSPWYPLVDSSLRLTSLSGTTSLRPGA